MSQICYKLCLRWNASVIIDKKTGTYIHEHYKFLKRPLSRPREYLMTITYDSDYIIFRGVPTRWRTKLNLRCYARLLNRLLGCKSNLHFYLFPRDLLVISPFVWIIGPRHCVPYRKSSNEGILCFCLNWNLSSIKLFRYFTW